MSSPQTQVLLKLCIFYGSQTLHFAAKWKFMNVTYYCGLETVVLKETDNISTETIEIAV